MIRDSIDRSPKKDILIHFFSCDQRLPCNGNISILNKIVISQINLKKLAVVGSKSGQENKVVIQIEEIT